MKHRQGKIHSFLIIAISFWVGLFLTCQQYNNLLEIDFSSPTPTLEILDQEFLQADEEKKAKVFALRFSCALFPFHFSFIEPFPFFSFQTLSFDQPISVLRC
jgi:hypothetical protein